MQIHVVTVLLITPILSLGPAVKKSTLCFYVYILPLPVCLQHTGFQYVKHTCWQPTDCCLFV